MAGVYPAAYKPESIPYQGLGAANDNLPSDLQRGRPLPPPANDNAVQRELVERVSEKIEKDTGRRIARKVVAKRIAALALKGIPYVGALLTVIEFVELFGQTTPPAVGYVPDLSTWQSERSPEIPYDLSGWAEFYNDYTGPYYPYANNPIWVGRNSQNDDTGLVSLTDDPVSSGVYFAGVDITAAQSGLDTDYVYRAYPGANESFAVDGAWQRAPDAGPAEWIGPVMPGSLVPQSPATEIFERRSKRFERGHDRLVQHAPSPDGVVEHTLRPGLRPRITTRGNPRPGGPKERKLKGGKFISIVWRAISEVTEFNDGVEAVWDALPDEFKTGYYKLHKKGGEIFYKKRRDATPQQMLRDIYRHYDKVDLEDALVNLIVAQVKDSAIGKTSRGITKESQWYLEATKRPVGLTAGPAI